MFNNLFSQLGNKEKKVLQELDSKYPFSPGTPEAEALNDLSWEGRVAILQATELYKDAVHEALVREQNHPRMKAFQDWLTESKANKAWYTANKDKLKFVTDGISILGDVFFLDDEQAEENGVDVWNYEGNTYFTFDAAQEHARSQGKQIPASWSKYIDFLPGNDANKLKFLSNVLWLKFSGLRNWKYGEMHNQGTDAYYWLTSSDAKEGEYLYFDTKNIYTGDKADRTNGFPIRCLKKGL